MISRQQQEELIFQSTLPARGATAPVQTTLAEASDFNPRSPRGERLCSRVMLSPPFLISIHAPREGSDPNEYRRREVMQFISIHAPREGSDGIMGSDAGTSLNFNPRSPRGERRDGVKETPISGRISIHAPREGSDGKT